MTRFAAFAFALSLSTPALADCALADADGITAVPCAAFLDGTERTATSFRVNQRFEGPDFMVFDDRAWGPLVIGIDRPNGSTLYVTDPVVQRSAVLVAADMEAAELTPIETEGTAYMQTFEYSGAEMQIIGTVFGNDGRGWSFGRSLDGEGSI